jgi:hypothetical protein
LTRAFSRRSQNREARKKKEGEEERGRNSIPNRVASSCSPPSSCSPRVRVSGPLRKGAVQERPARIRLPAPHRAPPPGAAGQRRAGRGHPNELAERGSSRPKGARVRRLPPRPLRLEAPQPTAAGQAGRHDRPAEFVRDPGFACLRGQSDHFAARLMIPKRQTGKAGSGVLGC